MANGLEFYVVTGSCSVSLTGALDTSGTLNFKNRRGRNFHDSVIRGELPRRPVYVAGGPIKGHPTEVYSGSVSPPSWTQYYVGKRHGFVIPELSSSVHERDILNAYVSGTAKLENTVVAATGTLLYSKESRYNYVMYKMTASAAIGNTFYAASGSGIFQTASFRPNIFVSEYGRLRNIRVWVEIIHPPASGTNLGTQIIGLRSPNVRFKHGVPYVNDPRIVNRAASFDIDPGDSALRNSYVLWYGQAGQADSISLVGLWELDVSMRTIFDDASPYNNPRCWDPVFFSGSTSHQPYLIGINGPTHGLTGFPRHTGTIGVPWMSDAKASPTTGSRAGSPPTGWLTGQGGVTASFNEWPTTGSNFGPPTIRPAYPMLDDLFEVRDFSVGGGSTTVSSSYEGFRPGLRGTEIHGNWELEISNREGQIANGSTYFYFRQWRIELWYDTHEKNSGYVEKVLSRREKVRGNVFGETGKRRRVAIVSGGWSPYTGVEGVVGSLSNVYVENPYSHQRTVTLSTNTGSTNFAVFSQITGSLLEKITGSAQTNMLNSFIKNEFSTPYIPISSGSGENPAIFALDDDEIKASRALRDEILRPKTLIKQATTLKSTISRSRFFRSARDQVVDRIGLLSTLGNASGSTALI